MAPKLPRSSEVWHGKTYVLPSPEGPDAPPVVLAVWATDPDRLIVHFTMTPVAKGPVRLVTSFAEATGSPKVGSPRMPRRIVVEDRQSADQLQRLHGVQALVRDVPMVDELTRGILTQALRENGGTPTPTGRVSSTAQLELQKAAALLWKAAPWRLLFDSEWILIDAPGDPLDEQVISVLGNREEVFGFCLYPSLDEAASFFEQAEASGSEPPEDAYYLLLSINSSSDLHPSERRQPAPASLGKRRAVVMKQAGTPPAIPPTEADTLSMARVARALAAFDSSTGRGGADGLSLRFVYDDEDLGDDDDLGPTDPETPAVTSHETRSRLSAVQSSTPAPASTWAAFDRDRFPALMSIARRRGVKVGPGTPPTCLDYDLVFGEAGDDGLTSARAWRQSEALDEKGVRWFESNGAARSSVHRVLGVTPGQRLHLEDIFTGEKRWVVDRSASTTDVVGWLVCARVVETEGECWLSAIEPNPVPEGMAVELRAQVGTLFRLPKVKPIAEERIPRLELSNLLSIVWADLRKSDNTPRAPTDLRNTDGHPLVGVTEHFVTLERERLLAWLDRQPQFRHTDGDDLRWEWWRDGIHGNPDMTTTLGHVTLDGRRVIATTNSVERADLLASSLQGSGAVRHERRTTAPLKLPNTAPPARPSKVPTPDELAAVVAFKTQHYATWPAIPVPALGGKSPREAVRTAKGRAEVEAMLRELERIESQSHGPARYDVNILRRDLGLMT